MGWSDLIRRRTISPELFALLRPEYEQCTDSIWVCDTDRSARARSGFRVKPDPIANPEPTRGTAAFIYIPANGGKIETFDHVRLQPRAGGFKLHLQKDKTLQGMTA